MQGDNMLIAVCGLECESCEIRRAPFDPQAAQALVAWFQEMGWLAADEGMAQVMERRMVCQGCRGDRSLHWSADCWILKCCVDDRGLDFCYQCADFPCRRLSDWATQNDGYRQALTRLQAMSRRQA
jgi:hypothetical protein